MSNEINTNGVTEEKKMVEALHFDVDENGHLINNEIPDVSKIDPEEKVYTGGAVVKKTPKTAVYIDNSKEAGETCNMIFHKDIVESILYQGTMGDKELPVDIESGDYLTENGYIRLFDTSMAKVIAQMDDNGNQAIDVVPYYEMMPQDEVQENYDEETGAMLTRLYGDENDSVLRYVQKIYIHGCMIVQVFNDYSTIYIIIKDKIPNDYLVLEM